MSKLSDYSEPSLGDKNFKIGGQDLRSRISLKLNILIIFTVMFAIIGFIASIVLSSIVYNKHEKNLGDEKNLALWTPITCALGFVFLLIFMVIFFTNFNPRLAEEDRFLTSMTRVAAEPIEAQDIREGFRGYLQSALKSQEINEDDVRRFGNLLAQGDGRIYDLPGSQVPTFLARRNNNFIQAYSGDSDLKSRASSPPVVSRINSTVVNPVNNSSIELTPL